GASDDVHFQRWAVGQCLDQGGDVRLRRVVEHGAAGREIDVGQVFAAAEGGGQQLEGRGHRLGDRIDDHLHDDAAHREFRIVQRARDRQVDVDVAAGVLQQRNGQQHRQLERVGAAGGLAEGELVEQHLVAGLQGPVLDLVVQVDRQLAAFDGVADVLGRIRGETGQVHAL